MYISTDLFRNLLKYQFAADKELAIAKRPMFTGFAAR
jgi:hypothetical protein